MTWALEVKIGGRWEQVQPTGSPPYRFATRKAAEAARSLCYPGDAGWPTMQQMSRTVEVDDG